MSRRTSFHLVAAIGVAAAAIILAVSRAPGQAGSGAAELQVRPARVAIRALPVGHGPLATPSKTTLTGGEAYTCRLVAVTLSSSGNAGYWISSNDATTPAVNVTPGCPGAAPFTRQHDGFRTPQAPTPTRFGE